MSDSSSEQGSGDVVELVQQNAALCGAFGKPGADDLASVKSEPFDVLEQQLTAEQLQAIGLLLVGRSVAAVARIVGVNRSTVFRWRQQPVFANVLRFRQEMLFQQAADRLRATLLKAIREIQVDLQSRYAEQRLRTAFRLLPYVGSPRLRPTAPPQAVKATTIEQPPSADD